MWACVKLGNKQHHFFFFFLSSDNLHKTRRLKRRQKNFKKRLKKVVDNTEMYCMFAPAKTGIKLVSCEVHLECDLRIKK